MNDCIFCKIVNGDIPSYKVYEDDKIIAFLDISQTTKGHTLVIPKKHYANIYEITSDDISYLFGKIPMISKALKESVNCDGLNIINNTNEIAGQSVFHFHVHLIPRYKNNSDFSIKYTNNFNKYSSDELNDLSNNIYNKIKKA